MKFLYKTDNLCQAVRAIMSLSTAEQLFIRGSLKTADRLIRKKRINPEDLREVIAIVEEVRRIVRSRIEVTVNKRPRRDRYSTDTINEADFEIAKDEFRKIQSDLEAQLPPFKKRCLKILYLHIFEGRSPEAVSKDHVRFALNRATDIIWDNNPSEILQRILLGAKKPTCP